MGGSSRPYKGYRAKCCTSGLNAEFAEYAGADVLLTTDDKFVKACLKLNLNTRVLNPLYFLLEEMSNE
jgi:hypothetical protein